MERETEKLRPFRPVSSHPNLNPTLPKFSFNSSTASANLTARFLLASELVSSQRVSCLWINLMTSTSSALSIIFPMSLSLTSWLLLTLLLQMEILENLICCTTWPAITEVGEVIQFYDADKRFPAWGFGGGTVEGPVSHCFNLDVTATGYECPTRLQRLLAILYSTDGILTDLQETKDALVRASDLPLSILIVGVGRADFKQMEILDADNGQRLSSSTGRGQETSYNLFL
ncbi:hypothetical protein ACLB2K_037345 [Fragaria x ananassa]